MKPFQGGKENTAKVTGPLISIDASGAFADTMVYGKWKRINYSGQYAVPGNSRMANRHSITPLLFGNQGTAKESLMRSGSHYRAGQKLRGGLAGSERARISQSRMAIASR